MITLSSICFPVAAASAVGEAGALALVERQRAAHLGDLLVAHVRGLLDERVDDLGEVGRPPDRRR